MPAAAKEKPASPVSADQDVNGVEIFRAGSYQIASANGEKQTVSYSEDDVQQMAENGNALLEDHRYEPPAKLGHSETQKIAAEEGLPAAGWVKRLYRKGAVLMADFKQVPARLAEAIRRGRYKYVSSEIYDPEDTERNFGEFGIKGFSLRAVAFLGADIPVIKGLKPLMLAAGSDSSRVITLAVEDKKVMVRKFADASASDDSDDSKDSKDSDKEDFDEGNDKMMVHANRHPFGAMVKVKGKKGIHTVNKVNPDDSYDVSDLKDPSKESKGVAHDNLTLLAEDNPMEVKKLMEDLDAARKKNAALEKKVRDDKISAFCEKHKLYLTPALRPSFEAVAAAESGAIKLAEKEITFLDAFLAFTESLIGAKRVILGEVSPSKDGGDKTDAAKLAEAPFDEYRKRSNIGIEGAELAVRARSYAEEKGVTYRDALLAVALLTKQEAQ